LEKEMTSSIIIIGAGGHAKSVTNVALSCGYSVISYVDDNKDGTEILSTPVISTEECYRLYPNHNFCIAIGDNAVRERVVKELTEALPNAIFPPLIHKSSTIGVASKISKGSVVMPQSNIGPNSKVGSFCIVNSSASIDHDCSIEDFSSVAPGVITGGNVTLGIRSSISIGAVVKDGLSIGDDVVIGANSYVNKCVANNVVAYGNPCKVIRYRKLGDRYLR
jgi:sugar O-acyltransferase (sialic acid O-acetyltransferase NeuD family)